MKGVQVIGILVAIYLTFQTLKQYRKGNYGLKRTCFWLALWVLIGFLFAFPPLVELVLPVIAMQNTVLTTLVIGLVVVFVLVYYAYQQVARVERKLTELVQNLAVRDYVKEAGNPREKMNNKPIYVVIPAYNEEETVSEVVKGLKQLDLNLEIVVVDDGSRDKTAETAREAGAIVVRHLVNLGQWAALKTAFIISLLNHAEIVVTLDGDGQHSPEDLPSLIQPLLQNEADFVIGSRFIKEAKPKMRTLRYFGIKFFNILIRLNTGLKLSDCTSGYKAYRGSLVAQMLPRLKENQYGALEAIMQVSKLRARIFEGPITSIHSEKTTKGNLRYAYHLFRTIFKSMID